jgi:hypothetical protein
MTAGLHTANVANGWLNTLRGGSNFTAFASAFVKLHTGDPGSAGTSNAAAGSTTRPAVTWAAASGGAIAMNGTAPSWTNGGTSETITHISVWDNATAGNFMFSVALTASKAWVSTDTLTLNTLGVSLAPLAA